VIPSINLPMGIQLQAIADLSKGPPTDCALLHNLIAQLMPTLAGLNCIIKILNVIGALEGFLTAFPNLPAVVSKAGDVISAIGDMSDCLSIVLGPFAVIQTIKDILTVVISYLECFVAAIKSILDFQVGIDLNSAQGNPALLASLQCASDNAQTSMSQMLLALGPIAPLFKMVQPLIKISQLPIELPDIGSLVGAKDIASAVDQLDSMLLQMKQILQTIP
jgi:hypothetical protein